MDANATNNKTFYDLNDVWQFSYDFYKAIVRGIWAESMQAETDAVTFTGRELFTAIAATLPIYIDRGHAIPPFPQDNGAVRMRYIAYAGKIESHSFLFEVRTKDGIVKVPILLPHKKYFTMDEMINSTREQTHAFLQKKNKENDPIYAEVLRIADILEERKNKINLYQESRNIERK